MRVRLSVSTNGIRFAGELHILVTFLHNDFFAYLRTKGKIPIRILQPPSH